MGSGTYTGIEAVSNGLQIMRDPKVQTGKRTMAYMAASLAITDGGLLFCYLLFDVYPSAHKTLNSVLADSLFGSWTYGKAIAVITIYSEGALLFVASQAGFIDAPRVMANMAVIASLFFRNGLLSATVWSWSVCQLCSFFFIPWLNHARCISFYAVVSDFFLSIYQYSYSFT